MGVVYRKGVAYGGGSGSNTQVDWDETDPSSFAYILNKPTTLSEFTNDENFITNTVNNLTNYYTKTQVNEKVDLIPKFKIEVVISLLVVTDPNDHTVYLVPSTNPETSDIYTEYIYVIDEATQTGSFEKIGAQTVDLTNYIQKSITAGLLKNDGTVDTNTYATTSQLPSIATTQTAGLVKPDGTTITVDSNGTISASADLSNYIEKSATEGLVKNDGTIDTSKHVHLQPTSSGLTGELKTKTWNGYSPEYGEYIWTDGENTYYSSGSNQYVLDKSSSTWVVKEWTGLTSFDAYGIWTDEDNIYYSSGSDQYVLNKSTSTWSIKTWTGLTNFYGSGIWTDGENIYYSADDSNYVLNKSTSTWSTKSWSGLTLLNGYEIWTDGENIYYSYGSDLQYVLDKSTSTWSTKTWNGLTNLLGECIWTDGENVYYSYDDGGGSSIQYVLDKATSTWSTKSWSGYTSISGDRVWTDGENVYYSNGNEQYVFVSETVYADGFVKSDGSIVDLPVATITNAGTVKPDGTTITIDANGVISSVGGDESKLLTGWLVEYQWNNYSQTVTVSGLNSTDIGAIGFLNTITPAQLATAKDANIKLVSVSGNSITFSCEKYPSINIPFGILVTGSGSETSLMNTLPSFDETDIKPVLSELKNKTWSGMTSFDGLYIWTDGTDIYYSYNATQKKLNKATGAWVDVEWYYFDGSDYVLFNEDYTGNNVWTDGTNIYYNNWFVLDKSTMKWELPEWTGNPGEFEGQDVWTDGTNVYVNNDTISKRFNSGTGSWYDKTWNGLGQYDELYGRGIWTDGTHIFFNDPITSVGRRRTKILDVSTSTWSNMGTQEGDIWYDGLDPDGIWSDGKHTYYSKYYNGSLIEQLELDTENLIWTFKIWDGTAPAYGQYVWTDGQTYYYSNGSTQKVFEYNHIEPVATKDTLGLIKTDRIEEIESNLDNKLDKVANTTNSHVPKFDSNGNLVDSGISALCIPKSYIQGSVTLSTSTTTTCHFQSSSITTDSFIEVFVSEWGLIPEDVTVANGSCDVIFPKVDSARSVTCRIYLR